MRWLLVSSRHHPDHGGIGTAVAGFVHHATAAGWSVDLVTRPSDRLPAGARVHLVDTPDAAPSFDARVNGLRRLERIRPYRYGQWALAVARTLLEIDTRPDVIEFVDCQAEGVVALESRAVRARFPGVPMLVHAHTPMFVEETINRVDPRRFGRAIYHRWERRAFRAADGVLVTSHLLRERLGRPDAAVIPYPLASTDGRSRSDDGERLVLVGSVQRRKGADVWTRSLACVLRARPHARATLIGPDTPTAPGGGSMVRHLRDALPPACRARLRWHDTLPHAETLEAIAGARLVVVPSRLESFGFAAAEAILAGRPVVISDHVGLGEYVPDLPVVPAGDHHALAEAQVETLRRSWPHGRVRARLLAACAPATVLRRRAAFALALRPKRRRRRGGEAIDDMTRFLASVEATEAAEPHESRGIRA